MAASITYLVYIPHGQGVVYVNDEISYAIISKNDISMVICDSAHVESLLQKRCGCSSCGGQKACFRPASLEEITTWSKQE